MGVNKVAARITTWWYGVDGTIDYDPEGPLPCIHCGKLTNYFFGTTRIHPWCYSPWIQSGYKA